MTDELRPEQQLKPKWPPMWNPFEVFLLALSLISCIGLLRGSSGSELLDSRLAPITVVMWGAALGIGSALALAGVICYAHERYLMPGLYLERAGLTLVGIAAAVYASVVLHYAADLNGVRFSVSVQIAYSAACFFRAWQDHRAISRAARIYGRMTRHTSGGGSGR